MGFLVRGVPWLESWWSTFRTTEDYYPDAPHVVLGNLANEIVIGRRAGKTLGFERFFSNVEDRLNQTTDPSLVVVGLLEGIQNAAINNKLPLEVVDGWLGPTTRRYWSAVIAFWSGRITSSEFNELVSGKRSDSAPF
jgi:hypothetical protein